MTDLDLNYDPYARVMCSHCGRPVVESWLGTLFHPRIVKPGSTYLRYLCECGWVGRRATWR